MQVITHEDPRFSLLSEKTQEVKFPLSVEDKAVIEVLKAKMAELKDQAAGIAANQLGFSLNLFVAKVKSKVRVFINTKIMGYSSTKQSNPEGCLSLPGIVINTKRPRSVTVEFFDSEGNKTLEHFDGKDAQVIFHEVRHCEGKTIAHDFNLMASKEPQRTSFGMRLTPHRRKVIAARRAKKKANA